MWRDIDDALRFHVRKVVALLSRASVGKEGVRAELDRAASYRKKLEDRRFIIPVIIDDIPFDELPVTIGNRKTINGSGAHAAALAAIIKILEEDGTARSAAPPSNSLLQWQRVFGPSDRTVEKREDSLVSNWFPVRTLPTVINFYEIDRALENPIAEPARIAKEHHHAPFPGMEAAFSLKWPSQPQQVITLSDGTLETRIRYDDPYRRVYDTVDLIVTRLLDFKARSDVRSDVWITPKRRAALL